ncbi:MAG: sulfite exporter TauE/SafE family protein [Culicoidibacterales bacterium]
MEYIIILIISLISSVFGSICGIGGGILMKPILDATGLLSIGAISFLSSCTVLSMSSYSVMKAKMDAPSTTKVTALAGGAAIGGVLGKISFQFILGLFENQNRVGVIQAIVLLVLTLFTLIYTLKKRNIKTRKVKSVTAQVLIGLVLGLFSAFLGIGGGPINLILLHYYFSMDTKEAVKGSLYIILFSQTASLLLTIVSNQVPEVDLFLLCLMILSGIIGGVVGKRINQMFTNIQIDFMFVAAMIGIILINSYNIIK